MDTRFFVSDNFKGRYRVRDVVVGGGGDNIKIYLKEKGCEFVFWINLPSYAVHWRDRMDGEMNCWVV
jgi:hypothetical protein